MEGNTKRLKTKAWRCSVLRARLAGALLLAAVCAGCGASRGEPSAASADTAPENGAAAQRTPPTYTLETSLKSARAVVTVGGVPVYRKLALRSASQSGPVNANLTGEKTSVKMTVWPAPTEKGPARPEDMHAEATIKRYGPDVRFSTPEGGGALARLSLKQALEERREELKQEFSERLKAAPPGNKPDLLKKEAELTTPSFPIEIEAEFSASDAPSFASLLKEGEVIADTARLKDYAIHLRDLLRQRNTDALYEEYEPKLTDYDLAYPEEKEDDNRVWFGNMMQNNLYFGKLLTDFEHKDVGLREWAGGRVWELYVKQDGLPFGRELIKMMGPSGGSNWMEVYVAEVDGELKMIR